MNIRIQSQAKLGKQSVLLSLFEGQAVEELASWPLFNPAQKRSISSFLKGRFKGTDGELQSMTISHKEEIIRIFFLGLGESKKYNVRKCRLRIRQVIRQLLSLSISEVTLVLDDLCVSGQPIDFQAQQLAEQVVMANYSFTRKSKPNTKELKQINVVCKSEDLKQVKKAAAIGQTIAKRVNEVRDMCNIPGGEMTPKALGKLSKKMAQETGAEYQAFGEAKMKQLGMGGILGVSKGSLEEAQFILVKHFGGKKSEAPIVLVGKGITFDTGGLNLKPGKSIDGMHMDMSGAAAVVGAVCLAAELKLPINVIALVPAAENMPSGSSYRPGDILTTLSGKTIEIGNTDAEGRVVLADALDYAHRFSPQLVVDVATLTGASMVALGYRANALFTEDDSLAHAFEHLAEESGDYVWRLPLWDEYAVEVKGAIADVSNIGKYPGMGGAITGAHFLKVFAEGYPWVHIDMAPTMESIDDSFLAKGATGATVRLLIHLLRTKSNH